MIPSLESDVSSERLVWRLCQVSEELVYLLEAGRAPGELGDRDDLISDDTTINTALRAMFSELDQLGIEFTTTQMDIVEDNYRWGIAVTLRERFDGLLFSETLLNITDEHRAAIDQFVTLAEDGTVGEESLIWNIIGTFTDALPMSSTWGLLKENQDLFVNNERFTAHIRAILEKTPDKPAINDRMLPEIQEFMTDFVRKRERFGAALRFLNDKHQLITNDDAENLIGGYDRDKLQLLTSAGILDAADNEHHQSSTHHLEYYAFNRIPIEPNNSMEVVSALYSMTAYSDLEEVLMEQCNNNAIPKPVLENMRMMVYDLSGFDQATNYPLPSERLLIEKAEEAKQA